MYLRKMSINCLRSEWTKFRPLYQVYENCNFVLFQAQSLCRILIEFFRKILFDVVNLLHFFDRFKKNNI